MIFSQVRQCKSLMFCIYCTCPEAPRLQLAIKAPCGGLKKKCLTARNLLANRISTQRRRLNSIKNREAPVRFGYSSEMERFKRFRFSVLAVPLRKRFFCVSVQFNRKDRFRFRFLENGSGGSGSAFGFGKNGSDGSSFRFRFGS